VFAPNPLPPSREDFFQLAPRCISSFPLRRFSFFRLRSNILKAVYRRRPQSLVQLLLIPIISAMTYFYSPNSPPRFHPFVGSSLESNPSTYSSLHIRSSDKYCIFSPRLSSPRRASVSRLKPAPTGFSRALFFASFLARCCSLSLAWFAGAVCRHSTIKTRLVLTNLGCRSISSRRTEA